MNPHHRQSELPASTSAAPVPAEPAELGFGPPRGMRDFYPEDMAVRNAIFGAWTAAARRFGFAQYDACVVENLDLLKRKSGEEIVEQIYAFTDKSNRPLALRAEMTPTLARMIAARQGQLQFPLKWFAIAQCFRYERMSKGRKREHYQWNLDCIGEEAVTAEAEVVGAAVHSLSLLGFVPGDCFVHVNSRRLLAELFEKLGIRREHHAPAFLALDKRGKISDADVAAMLREAGLPPAAVDAAFQALQVQSLDDVRRLLGDETPGYRNLADFMALAALYGMRDWIRFDIGVIRGLGYYTGIVFEAFDAGRKFRAIFGGGRYDNLLADIGGKPASAVGLGFGDVVVAEYLAEAGKLRAAAPAVDLAIGYMEHAQQAAAIGFATAMRAAGSDVDLALRPEKAKTFFSRAGKCGHRRAVYIGPDDVARGTVRVKDLATRAETEMPISAGALACPPSESPDRLSPSLGSPA